MRHFGGRRSAIVASALFVGAVAVGAEAAAQSAAAPAEPPLAVNTVRQRQRVVPIAIAITDNAQAQAAQLAYIVESAARRAPRHEFVDPVRKFDPVGVELREQRRNKAIDAVGYGRRSYENLEEGLGLESFDRAISAYEESALWDNFRGFTEALAWRILVKWAEDQAATRKEVQRLVALDPKVEMPPDLTPPDLLQEVQKAKDALKAERRFSLDVSTDPVASRVYIDGVYRGTTPTSVRGLTAGEHYLSLVAPGYAVHQGLVRAGPGATATVTLKPAERANPFLTFIERIRKGFGDADEVTAARVLGRVSEADEVLIAGITRGGGMLKVHLHRIATADGHVLAMREIDVPESDSQFALRISQEAERILLNDRPRDKGEPIGLKSGFDSLVDSVTNIGEDKSKMIVGVGGGVLFLAGAMVGLVARGKEADVRAQSQTTPGLRDQLSSGFTTAITADVLMLAGLAGAGTWGWMQFGRKFSKKADIEAPPVLEQKKEPLEKKKPEPEEEDPFAALDADGPSVSPFAGATLDAAVFGVRGSF